MNKTINTIRVFSKLLTYICILSISFSALFTSMVSAAEDDIFNMENKIGVEESGVKKDADSVKPVHKKPILKNKKIIAVAEVKIGHPTAQLVFNEDVVRDIVTKAMIDQGSYDVIDWSRLKAVLFRRNLEWSDVVKEENQRKEIKDVLLNDYFLVGSISSFSDRWEYDSGAFSKSKTQIVTIQLDLFLKDAITNEIIASSKVVKEKRREVSQSLGFGATGGADQSLSIMLLGEAAEDVADELAGKLSKKESAVTKVKTKAAKDSSKQ